MRIGTVWTLRTARMKGWLLRALTGILDRMQAALWAELAAAKALIETAPTTRAGLRALESYLRKDRNNNARMGIQMTGTTDDGYTYTWSSGGPESVDWLIAKRAEIVGVA